MQKENHFSFSDFPLDEKLTENKNSLKLGEREGECQN